MTGMTQFGRALAELNIEIICTNFSQAKGRDERANRTLQDRLVKELRIAGISNMEDGNAFLAGFVQRYNIKFAKTPAKPDNLNRALNIEPDQLAEVFCLRDKRYATKDLTLKYDRKRIRLEVNDPKPGTPDHTPLSPRTNTSAPRWFISKTSRTKPKVKPVSKENP